MISPSDRRHAPVLQISVAREAFVCCAGVRQILSHLRAAATGAFVFAGATGDLVGVFLGVRTLEPVREFCTEDDLWLLVTGRRTYVEAYADLNMAALGERFK